MNLEIYWVAAASLLAGMVDSIVGGGGLILIPALFATFPSAEPSTLFGTNKSASVWGTSFAAYQYSKRVRIDWPIILPACAAALLGGFTGAWAVTQIDPSMLRKALPFILLVVLIYTLTKKNLGTTHAPRCSKRAELGLLLGIGGIIGWYDGFFGPGTGSFFIFLMVRLLHYDFLNASVYAKLLNVSTNIAAIALFAMKGHVWWQIGLTMAVTNVLGSLIGSHLALKHGPTFVRKIFIVVVGSLILKTAHDGYL